MMSLYVSVVVVVVVVIVSVFVSLVISCVEMLLMRCSCLVVLIVRYVVGVLKLSRMGS